MSIFDLRRLDPENPEDAALIAFANAEVRGFLAEVVAHRDEWDFRDREADVTDQRIDNHFTRLLNSMPGTYDGPTTGDRILRDTESGQTWIADSSGIWDATNIVTDVKPTDDGLTVTGRKRGNGITRVNDLWEAQADVLESGGGQMQGRVR